MANHNHCSNLELYENFFSKKEQDYILKYNERVPLEYRINADIMPDPYVGNPQTAEVFLLQLNPGSDFSPGLQIPNEAFERKVFPKLNEDNIKCIKQERMDYPFYHLNPDYRLTGGFRYWSNKFNSFLKTEADYKRIANKICCVQFFPYHSKKFKALAKNIILESQEYNFDLIRKAIENKKLIIIMRNKNKWIETIKELKDYNYLTLKSAQNPILTEANFKNVEEFKILKNALD